MNFLIRNRPAIGRIRAQMLTGHVIRRAMLVGPLWSGKTTLARILARYALCRDRRPGRGDLCGACASCRLELARHTPSEFRKWSGIEINHLWTWFAKPSNAALSTPDFVLFVDDAQHLSRWNRYALLSIIDRKQFVVLLATTPWGAIDRSLARRFDNAVYELRRPDPNDIAATY